MPFHFVECAANVLTINALNPVAKIPEYKACAVRIEKIAGAAAWQRKATFSRMERDTDIAKKAGGQCHERIVEDARGIPDD